MNASQVSQVEAFTGQPMRRFLGMNSGHAPDLDTGDPIPFVTLRFGQDFSSGKPLILLSKADALAIAEGINRVYGHDDPE